MNPVSSNKTCHVCVRYLQLGHISLHCKHCLLCLNGYTHDISYVCLTHICIVCVIIGASMTSTTLGELNGGFFIYIYVSILSSVVYRFLNANYHTFNLKHCACHVRISDSLLLWPPPLLQLIHHLNLAWSNKNNHHHPRKSVKVYPQLSKTTTPASSLSITMMPPYFKPVDLMAP